LPVKPWIPAYHRGNDAGKVNGLDRPGGDVKPVVIEDSAQSMDELLTISVKSNPHPPISAFHGLYVIDEQIAGSRTSGKQD